MNYKINSRKAAHTRPRQSIPLRKHIVRDILAGGAITLLLIGSVAIGASIAVKANHLFECREAAK